QALQQPLLQHHTLLYSQPRRPGHNQQQPTAQASITTRGATTSIRGIGSTTQHDYFSCVSTFWTATRGYVAECANGEYTHSAGVSGACSRDGGVSRTLYSH